MKNIYLRKGGYWFAKMVNGKRCWINLLTSDYPKACQLAAQIIQKPLLSAQNRFDADIQRFLVYKSFPRKGQYSAATMAETDLVLKNFFKTLPEGATITSVRTADVQSFYDRLTRREERPIAQATGVSYVARISAFFNWAVEEERARHENPCDSVELPVILPKGRVKWCDKRLKNKLIKNAPDDDLKFILYCGFEAGLRRLEIVEARRDWFDLKHGSMWVRRAVDNRRLQEGEKPFTIKDRTERQIGLTKDFRAFLMAYLRKRKDLDYCLRPDVKHGTWRYRYDFRRPFDDYMLSQKCEWVTPHVMRHSFASILAADGVDITKIAIWMDIDVETARTHYLHFKPVDPDIHRVS